MTDVLVRMMLKDIVKSCLAASAAAAAALLYQVVSDWCLGLPAYPAEVQGDGLLRV